MHILQGTVAGFVATLPMSISMHLLFKELPRREKYPLPPRLLTVEVARRAGVADQMDNRDRAAATVASHFAYGAACGAIYGAVAPDLPGPRIIKGIVFGLCVWTGSYMGWVPAVGLMPHATEEPWRRNLLMIAAHVVFGAVLGVLVGDSPHPERTVRRARREREREGARGRPAVPPAPPMERRPARAPAV